VKRWREPSLGGGAKGVEDRVLRAAEFFTEGRAALHGHEQGDMAAFAQELLRKREQGRGLADLTRGVEHEVLQRGKERPAKNASCRRSSASVR
jgi:hypothetical protein